MKKFKGFVLAVVLLVAVISSSCATLFYGKITECQKTKPATGQPSRALRVLPFVLDCTGLAIGNPVPFVVDFLTGAIYKPCK